MFKIQLRELICSPSFILSSTGFFLLMLFQSIPDITHGFHETATITKHMDMIMLFSFVGIAAAIPPVIPLAWQHSVGWENSTYYIILRSGKRKYYWGKISSAILTGMLSSGISCGLYCLTLSLLGVPMGPPLWGQQPGAATIYLYPMFQYLDNHNLWGIMLALEIFSHMAFAGICCMVALTLSAFTSNRYLLLGGPFLGTMGLSLIAQFNHTIQWLDPTYVKIDYQNSGATIFRTITYLVVACAALGLIYWYQTERRLRNG